MQNNLEKKITVHGKETARRHKLDLQWCIPEIILP